MITMWQAFLNFWRGYFNFTNQATRAEYWWMELWRIILTISWLILLIISFVVDAWLTHVGTSLPTHGIGNIFHQLFTHFIITAIVIIIGLVLLLAMIIPSISLRIRRYRDTGMTSWAAWLIWAITVLGGILGSVMHNDTIMFIAGLFSLIGFIVSLLATNAIDRWAILGRHEVVKQPTDHIIDTKNDEL